MMKHGTEAYGGRIHDDDGSCSDDDDDVLSTVSVLYAIALICTYLACTYAELATFPAFYNYTETHGLFIYLYGLSIAFYSSILFHSVRSLRRQSGGRHQSTDLVSETDKSHASFAIRVGAVIFGILALIYITIELVWNLDFPASTPTVPAAAAAAASSSSSSNHHSYPVADVAESGGSGGNRGLECKNAVLALNDVLILIFVILQTVTIVLFPRLSLNINRLHDKFGTMHVVATNIIVWLRILAKETVHEMLENEEMLHNRIAQDRLAWLHHMNESRDATAIVNEHHNQRRFSRSGSSSVQLTDSEDADISQLIIKSSKCHSLISSLERLRAVEHSCHKRQNYLSEEMISTFSVLFPPVIEYSLIGATFAYLMWLHIGSDGSNSNDNGDGDSSGEKGKTVFANDNDSNSTLPSLEDELRSQITMNADAAKEEQQSRTLKLPDARSFMAKCNVSKSVRGAMFGVLVLVIAIFNLAIFYGIEDSFVLDTIDIEYTLKALNTVVNVAGIIAVATGFHRIYWDASHLTTSNSTAMRSHKSLPSDRYLLSLNNSNRRAARPNFFTSSLDLNLLYFTYFFVNLYLVITVITGVVHIASAYGLGVMAGVVELIQAAMQIAYIGRLMRTLHQSRMKTSTDDASSTLISHRPETIFLAMLNFGQWLVTTFEVQKLRSSHVEAAFYGFLPWIVIQRVTLPLFVFFRFHSAVVCLELWKSS